MDKRPIDSIQVKLIHIAKGKLGLSDEAYRLILNQRYWVNTCKGLSYDEASDLIKHFQMMGFKIVTKRYSRKKLPPDIAQLPSKEILAKINHLIEDIHWRIKPDGYQRWLKKYMHIERPRTMIEAQKIVEALKAMRDRQQRAQRDTGTSLRRDGGMHGGRWQW